mmetsp:Transcript_127935/g.239303  ORF Transcript_127935/g.239303 Transcript_127935/m.239303 type:complete len:467 (-) Transcript_127935:84-1484(-)
MRSAVFVVVCLAHANCGVRVHRGAGHTTGVLCEEDAKNLPSPAVKCLLSDKQLRVLSSLKPLAALLLAFNPVAVGQTATDKAVGTHAALRSRRPIGHVHMNVQLPSGDEVPKLSKCTIAVAGANGRVGSSVCRELLRRNPEVTVRALIRDANDPMYGYGRLSYEVGAEEGRYNIKPAWVYDEDSGRFGAQTMEFDEERQGGYGLDRLEIREVDLRYGKDAALAFADVDAVVYCATAFDGRRNRLPERVADTANAINKAGMAFFELRFGDLLFGNKGQDDENARRREEVKGRIADVEGLDLAVQVFEKAKGRRAQLNKLTGGQPGSTTTQLPIDFVLVSSAAALCYSDISGEENGFGKAKRMGEAILRETSLPHLIIRAAEIDETVTPDMLDVKLDEKPPIAGPAGYTSQGPSADRNAVLSRRINPRDIARYIADQICQPLEGNSTSKTVEVWTGSMEGLATFKKGV